MRSTRPLQPLAGLYRRYLDTIGHLPRAWCPTLSRWTERRLDILDTLDTTKEPIPTLTHSNDVQGVQSLVTPGFGVGHLCLSGVQSVQKPCGSEKAEGHGLNGSPTDLRAAFEERAAIAEFDGGLDRDAAERLAWAEVTDSLNEPDNRERLHTGPAGDDAAAWRAWMRRRIPVWQARGLTTAEAARSVWSEAEDAWHRRHGATPDPDRCAGCGEWMLDGPGIRLPDGVVVHFGNPGRLDCLIIYGEAWRAAASAGLVALGLRKPQP
jgi:hypothetical protein